MGTLYLGEQTAPSTPPANQSVLYVKADGLVYWKDDAGTEYSAGYSANAALAALAALTPAANKFPYFTSGSAAALADISASGRSIVNLAITAKGDLIVGSASATGAIVPVGSNGQILAADSADAEGVVWVTVPISVVVSTASGTHSVPTSARRAKVYVKAAGGSGGGSSSAINGGGGGEGEERFGWITVVPGTTVTVTLNNGGAGINANTNSNGNDGGTSVWTDGTATITANGGKAGSAGNVGSRPGVGGSGGSGGDYGMPGAAGVPGGDTGGATTAIYGPGGGKGGSDSGTGAAAVANSGGGGGGGSVASASGAGAKGIIVTEYWP